MAEDLMRSLFGGWHDYGSFGDAEVTVYLRKDRLVHELDPGFDTNVRLWSIKTSDRKGRKAIVANRDGGAELVQVRTYSGVLIANVPAGETHEFLLTDNSTTDGSWAVGAKHTAWTEGAALSANRMRRELTISWSGREQINFRDMLDQQGYDGVTPVALVVTIKPSVAQPGILIRGGPDQITPAVDTGFWPSGSTCLLLIEENVIITGAGGEGGDGGTGGAFGTPPTDGLKGGPALRIKLDTWIDNGGTVQGGGGGGGGGAGGGNVGEHGGGGGGGAGDPGGPGGAGTWPAGDGFLGSPTGGGQGGFAAPGGATGGRGGEPTTMVGSDGGDTGTWTGGSGGAAGAYQRRDSSVTVTWVRVGNRYGVEEVV